MKLLDALLWRLSGSPTQAQFICLFVSLFVCEPDFFQHSHLAWTNLLDFDWSFFAFFFYSEGGSGLNEKHILESGKDFSTGLHGGDRVRVSNYRHWLDMFPGWKDEKNSPDHQVKSQIRFIRSTFFIHQLSRTSGYQRFGVIGLFDASQHFVILHRWVF